MKITQSRRALGFLRSAAPYSRQTSPVSEELRGGASVQVDNSQTLTHLDQAGAAHMVNISHKAETTRSATAVATLLFSKKETYAALSSYQVVKGDAIAVARVAAFQAAKKTADLIPLAHPSLHITAMTVDINPFRGEEKSFLYTTIKSEGNSVSLKSREGGVTVKATVECQGKTGVEMEAITAATVGAVTMYDMLKAIDKGLVLMGARVIEKKGGKSGDWVWDEHTNKLVRPNQTGHQDSSYTDAPQIHHPLPEASEIDEWNKGLAEEFSVTKAALREIDTPKVPKQSTSLDQIHMVERATDALTKSMVALETAMAKLRRPSQNPEDSISSEPAVRPPSSKSSTGHRHAPESLSSVDKSHAGPLPQSTSKADVQSTTSGFTCITQKPTPTDYAPVPQGKDHTIVQQHQVQSTVPPPAQPTSSITSPLHNPHSQQHSDRLPRHRLSKSHLDSHITAAKALQSELRASIASSKPFVEAVGRTFEAAMAADAEVEKAHEELESGVTDNRNKEWWPETMTKVDREVWRGHGGANLKKVDRRAFESRAFEREWEKSVYGKGSWIK